ncbi:hypothetical protein ACQ4WX_43010 [Streptomyces lasalocidi]
MTGTVTAQGPLPAAPALGVAMLARLDGDPALGVALVARRGVVLAIGAATLARPGADPAPGVDLALPDGGPAVVYEPRIGADRAAERRARFRTAVRVLFDA